MVDIYVSLPLNDPLFTTAIVRKKKYSSQYVFKKDLRDSKVLQKVVLQFAIENLKRNT